MTLALPPKGRRVGDMVKAFSDQRLVIVNRLGRDFWALRGQRAHRARRAHRPRLRRHHRGRLCRPTQAADGPQQASQRRPQLEQGSSLGKGRAWKRSHFVICRGVVEEDGRAEADVEDEGDAVKVDAAVVDGDGSDDVGGHEEAEDDGEPLPVHPAPHSPAHLALMRKLDRSGKGTGR